MGDFDDGATLVDAVPAGALEDVFPEGAPKPLTVSFVRGTYQGAIPADERQVALEILTRNRVYVIGFDLTCHAVIDRRTRESTTEHAALGARLVGGQRRYGKTVHFARPFPVPGTEAVFEREGGATPAAITSRVQDVRLYIRVDSMVVDEDGAWEDVTSAFLSPPRATRK